MRSVPDLNMLQGNARSMGKSRKCHTSSWQAWQQQRLRLQDVRNDMTVIANWQLISELTRFTGNRTKYRSQASLGVSLQQSWRYSHFLSVSSKSIFASPKSPPIPFVLRCSVKPDSGSVECFYTQKMSHLASNSQITTVMIYNFLIL